MSGENAYELFKKGSELLEQGDFMAASVPLERARSLEPDKGSIREALGRAYFRSARFEQAAEEFAAVVERYPVNDYAHFCLGRSLEKTGRRAEARRHAALAANMRPDRKDYQAFRDRLQTPLAAPHRDHRLGHQAEQAVEPRSSTAADGMSAWTQMSRERVQPKRTRRVWRFHQSSIHGSRSPAAWSASAWTRSSSSAIRRPPRSARRPRFAGTVRPHSAWASRRASRPGSDRR